MPIPQALNIIPFTEHVETIKMLYMTDATFKTLWDDYVTSKVNSEKFKWKLLEDMKSELEYEELSMDLEREILEYLRKRG
jgi:hypothetical protein